MEYCDCTLTTTDGKEYEFYNVPMDDVWAIKATIKEGFGFVNLDYEGCGHTSIPVEDIENFSYDEVEDDD